MKLGRKNLENWLFWPGLALTLLGAAYFVGNYCWYRTRTWSLVRTPILLASGSNSTQQFTSNITERFLIMLEVDRDVPEGLSAKVLGIRDPGSEDPGENHGFKMRWAVFENGTLLKQGISDGNGQGFWSARKGRVLTTFPVQNGRTYRLETDVLEDGSALHPYHPTLTVAVDLFTLDGYAIGASLSQLAGLIIGGIGLALTGASILLWTLRQADMSAGPTNQESKHG